MFYFCVIHDSISIFHLDISLSNWLSEIRCLVIGVVSFLVEYLDLYFASSFGHSVVGLREAKIFVGPVVIVKNCDGCTYYKHVPTPHLPRGRQHPSSACEEEAADRRPRL